MRSTITRSNRTRRGFGPLVATSILGASLLGGAPAWAATALIPCPQEEGGEDPEPADPEEAAPEEEVEVTEEVTAEAEAPPAPPIAIRAARVILRPGKSIENAIVLIEKGRVVAVGPDVVVPEGATIVQGEVVCAGFMDPWSIAGVESGTARSSSSSASASAADVIDPYGQEDVLDELVAAGVLMTRSQAASAANISGIDAVVRTAGPDVVVSEAALSAAVGVTRGGFNQFGPQQFPGNVRFAPRGLDPIDRVGQIDRLMGNLASGKKYGNDLAKFKKAHAEWEKEIADKEKELAKDFKKAKKARDKKVADAEKKGEEVKDKKYKEDRRPRAPKLDPDKHAFSRVVNGELPLVISANRALEIREILSLTKPYPRVRLVIAGGTSALACASELSARGVPVIVTPSPANPGGAVGDLDPGLSLCAELDAAGVEVLIGSGGSTALASRDLALLAALAVGHGFDREAALRAITSGPASVFDVGRSIGTVQRGRAAELLVLSGDPLASSTRVLAAISNGAVVFEAGE